jgi:hypothetical protein
MISDFFIKNVNETFVEDTQIYIRNKNRNEDIHHLYTIT